MQSSKMMERFLCEFQSQSFRYTFMAQQENISVFHQFLIGTSGIQQSQSIFLPVTTKARSHRAFRYVFSFSLTAYPGSGSHVTPLGST